MKRAHEKRYVLRYYQFVPFILLLQAMFYLFPRLFWRSFSRHSGIDVSNLMDAAHSLKTVKRFHKQKSIITYLISLIHQYVGDPRKRMKQQHSKVNAYFQGIVCCVLGSSNVFNAYLFLLYIFVKILFLFNALMQLYLIRLLLEEKWTVNETLKGFRQVFTADVLRANPLSKYFPKISMCDFRIIEPNSDEGHKYTVQCKCRRSHDRKRDSIVFQVF
jgi:innexin